MIRKILDLRRAVLMLAQRNPTSSAFMRSQSLNGRATAMPQWVDIGRVSPYLLCAVIGVEDPLFFEHRGIWWNGICQSVLRSMISRSQIKGVSTISQQLSRNLFLGPERTVRRKLCEAIIAIWIERILPKPRILELYLNLAQFGDTIWGVNAASRAYFGKTPSELEAFEAVFLASLLPAPCARLSGKNARRAVLSQRAASVFLYSVGLISLAEQRHIIVRAEKLHRSLVEDGGLNLCVALYPLDERVNRNATVCPISSVELLETRCGWHQRLEFERHVRAVEHRVDYCEKRPLWWYQKGRAEQTVLPRG